MDSLRDLWSAAGLEAVETREIAVQRTFADFDDLWTISMKAPTLAATVAQLPAPDMEAVKARLRARLPADKDGRITYAARANAIKGRKPAAM